MNPNKYEFTLLNEKQINPLTRIDVLKKMGIECAISDFAVLLGAFISSDNFVPYDQSQTGRVCWYYLTDALSGYVKVVNSDNINYNLPTKRSGGIRPVFKYENINDISPTQRKNSEGVTEVEYGEYPQYAVKLELNFVLENAYRNSKSIIKKTGKTYTVDSNKWDDFEIPFDPLEYEEYEYNGEKYIRVISNCYKDGYILSNNQLVKPRNIVWVKVAPITWYVDEKEKLLISKNALVSGIRFYQEEHYNGVFANAEMYNYLNKYFAKDIVSQRVYTLSDEERIKIEKRKNPYNLTFNKMSEEDIVKGSIESGVAVFLHGPSSEGKSARVKEIDPNCVIIYLGSASPEAINGKSVYNSITNEMIDVKPSWLRKLEKLCEEEPDKNHVVFFDELTNALPSIQSIAFNIVLDREVNGLWKLPDNARIVAAGNEMNDSLAANQLAEPLFNRFAHVYIKTTTESWLKWASEHKIHPAIYAYIAYKKGSTLRSKYDGEKPNADPRKWEMASKMLYKVGNPEIIRSLVGEDITKEFVQFCNQQVITLNDVINGDYTNTDIDLLNTAERYATVMALSAVDENNLETVRSFVEKLGSEFTSIFDGMWTHGDEKRLERLMEAKYFEEDKIKK